MRKGEEWSGRQCCRLPQSGRCQRACVTASSRQDLAPICRQSDELSFFTCLDRQELGDDCCGGARSAGCQDACRAVFRGMLTPSREVRAAVLDACNNDTPKVIECVKNFTKVTPATNVHKCKNQKCADSPFIFKLSVIFLCLFVCDFAK